MKRRTQAMQTQGCLQISWMHSSLAKALGKGQCADISSPLGQRPRRFCDSSVVSHVMFATDSGQAHSPPCQGGVSAPLTKWIRSEKGADGVVAHKRCFGMRF